MTGEASQPAPASGRWRDPDTWLEVGCWLVVAFAVVQVAQFGYGRDQSIYAVVGESIRSGGMPYRDAWDFKPPGIFLVHALGQALFGRTMLAPRLLEAAGMVACVWAAGRLGATLFGGRRVGLLGGATAALLHAQFEFWHTGQPEQFGAFVTVFALLLTVEAPAGRPWGRWAAIGVLFGVAFLFKPPLGGGALVCAAALVRRARADGAAWPQASLPLVAVGAASLVPLAVCAGWFRARGAWDALAWTLFEFTPGYTRLGWHAGSSAVSYFYYAFQQVSFAFSALLGVGLLAALGLRAGHSREGEGIALLAGIGAVQLAGVAMQGKFFAYHYGATTWLLGLIAGVGWYKIWRRALQLGPGGGATFAVGLWVVAHAQLPVRDLNPDFWTRSERRLAALLGRATPAERRELDRDLYRVADYSMGGAEDAGRALARLAGEGGAVFLWGFEPMVYWAAERPRSSRFLYDVPQRATWERDRARRELLEELRRTPPAALAVQYGDVFHWVTGDSLDSAGALTTFPELAAIIEDEYRFVERVDDFDLYVRAAPGGSAAAPVP